MKPGIVRRVGLALFACLVFGPAAAIAQSITGTVTDDTGGVLPGVTVAAASPALIEEQRLAVTDGEGRFNVANLRPGVYTVEFALAGFGTILQEGVQLTTGVAVTINAELLVGGVEESITVSSVAPTVDVQNVRRQQVVTDELLDALPTSTKHVNTLVTLTAGFTGLADVGGQYTSQVGGTYHGKAGTKVSMDGMNVENSSGNSSYQINAAVIEEMVMETSGISAETDADGPVVNIIPKEGSNTLSGILSGFYADSSMEASNLTPELIAAGIPEGNKTIKVFDKSASLGGPIVRDKLWFFGAARSWGFSRKLAGVFWNQTQSTLLTPPGATAAVVKFTPWVDRPDDRASGRLEWYDSYLTRITWQASERNKFNVMYDEQRACNCGSISAIRSHEATFDYRFQPNRLVQASWTSARTSRLLLEAGATGAISQWNSFLAGGVEPSHVNIQDQGLGIEYGSSRFGRGWPNHTDRYTSRFSASYVTGSHNIKVGTSMEQMVQNTYYIMNAGGVSYRFNNGVPNRITQYVQPYLEQTRVNPSLGIYAQDQWTMDRFTLNLGVRFDYFNGYVPAQESPGLPTPDDKWAGFSRESAFVGPRSFDRVSNTPTWKDINPRLGVAYDLFGNSRTALKFSAGRYVAKMGTEIAQTLNPVNTSVNSANRSWNDVNTDFVPDCDLTDLTANGECGAIQNSFFGQGNPGARQWSPNVLNGWGVRDNNWDISAQVQHELAAGLSMTGGYYWNNGGYNQQTNSKFRVTDNTLVGAGDYDPFCITAPLDSRLPGGGGYDVCGMANINPAKLGVVQTVETESSLFGKDIRRNHFLNLEMTARLGGGVLIGGGVDTGKSIEDRCFVVDSPQELLHCRIETPFSAQTQFKMYAAVPLPGEFAVSGTYQNLSGPDIGANYAASNAEIMGSLGRPLAGGARTSTVPLVAPQTLFGARISRLDLRLTKKINVGNVEFQINLDAYNALNNSVVRTYNNTFGSKWQSPTTIIDPRLIEIGGQINF